MRFHYVPTTYRGRKFGRGYYGGGYIGYGRICGGSLADLVETPETPESPVADTPVNIPVDLPQIEENIEASAPPELTDELIERARKIIALAEATGRAQPITKKEAGLWSGLKNFGSKAWNASKAVGKTALKGAWTATKYGVPLALGATALATVPGVRSTAVNYLAPLAEKYLPESMQFAKPKSKFKEYSETVFNNAKKIFSEPFVKKGIDVAKDAIEDKAMESLPPSLKYTAKAVKAYNKYIKGEEPKKNEVSWSDATKMVKDVYNKFKPEEKKKKTSWSDAGKELYGNIVDEIEKSAGRTDRNLLNTLAEPITIPFNAVKNYLTKKPEPKPSLWNRAKTWFGFGSGYKKRRRGRFRKGSIEAKLYMARLRAMRANKKRTNFRGSGLNGGMFRGIKAHKIEKLLIEAQKRYNTKKYNKLKNKPIKVEWTDHSGHKRKTPTTYEKLFNMLDGIQAMQDYFKYDEKGRERNKLEQKMIRHNLVKNSKMRPQTRMSHNLMKNIIDLYQNKADYQHIKDYLKARTTQKFRNKWLKYNYYIKKYPKDEYKGKFNRVGEAKRDLLSQIKYIRKKKEGKIKNQAIRKLVPDGFDNLPIVLTDNAAEGFAKDPSVGTPK